MRRKGLEEEEEDGGGGERLKKEGGPVELLHHPEEPLAELPAHQLPAELLGGLGGVGGGGRAEKSAGAFSEPKMEVDNVPQSA